MTAVPLVSVVIPAYNNGRTLAETVRSVLGQEGVAIELIIADHSSDDDSLEIAQSFGQDDRVTVLTTPAGGGAARNWNRATEAAQGDLLKLVCGDDVLLPGTLARQARILADPGVTLTACRRDIVDARGRTVKRGWGLRGLGQRIPGTEAVRRAVRAGSNLFGEPASVMMRRRSLDAAGGWFPRFPYLIDQASYTRVLMEGDFAPDTVTGATFRMSAAQWSVALTRHQASQARAYNHWVHETYPEVLSRRDVLVGDTRAWLMARARRVSYALLDRRMR